MLQNLRELVGIVHGVQLGAAYQRDAALDEILMEIGIGVGRAVGGDQKLRPVEPWRVHGRKLDLHRPLAQLGLLGRPDVAGGFLPVNGPRRGAGAAAGQFFFLFCLRGQNGGFVVGSRFPFYEGDRAGGAGGKAVAQTVAVVVPHQLRLAVYHGDGALVARRRAGAAAVAFFPVDFNNSANHNLFLLLFWGNSEQITFGWTADLFP